MNPSKDFMAGWLRGFFDGEGSARFSHYFRTNGRRATHCYLSVGNTDTALQMRCCEYLSAFGIGFTEFSENASQRRKGRKPFFILHIVRQSEILKFSELVGFSAPHKVEALKQMVAWINRDRQAIWNDRKEFMVNLWNGGHSCRCIARRLNYQKGGHARVGRALRMWNIQPDIYRKPCDCAL
jgi:hypothetical protein